MLINKRRRAATITAAALACAAIWIPGLVGAAASGSSNAGIYPPLLDGPPLFGAADQEREAAAQVPGQPAAVRLEVTDLATGTRSSSVMRPGTDGRWLGAIPGAAAGSHLIYSVVADYADGSTTSAPAHLFVLKDVTPVDATTVDNPGRILLTVRLGKGLLGVRGGNESATEIPPAFAVDDLAKRFLVLDAVNGRVVAFDAKGHVKRAVHLKTNTTTASDIVVDTRSHTARVLDQAQDSLIEMTSKGQHVVSGLGVRGSPYGARLTYDAGSDATYVRDATQGRHVPVTAHGRRSTSSQRSSGSRAGVPTSLGDLATEIDDHSVTLGLTGTASRGFRLGFTDQVLDAGETLVDGGGLIWTMVGLYQRDTDTAYTLLVRLDPASGVAKATRVPSAVPGDVTRRLAPTRRGVALLEGEGNTLRLVGFDQL